MLARFTHILTFVAFTAHALFGCCGHHTHVGFDACCTQTAHSLSGHPEEDLDSSGHEHLNAAANMCGDHQSHSNGVNGGDLAAAIAVPNGDHSCPNDHSHHCNGIRCTYVVGNSNSTEAGQGPGAPATIAGSHWLMSADAIGLQHDRNMGSVHGGGLPSTAFCAVLQSWQI